MARALAETHLYHLEDDYNVWKTLPDGATNSRIVLSESITKKIIKLRSLDFSLADIRTPNLEILCILQENQQTFRTHRHNDLADLAAMFLKEVNETVKTRIGSAQQVMRGQGCNVSPSPATIGSRLKLNEER